MRRVVLVGIILMAFVLRFIGLVSHPAGFTPDEASFGYDAYSILKTGKDQWGSFLPLTLQSFGDYKLPLYTYLAIPSVAIFGLNEFAVRLPSAVFGTLAILATYLMVKGLFGGSKLEILAAWLLAVSPWHISLSRGAFEANLTTFFMPLGVWAFYKGLEKPRWMAVAALAFGLNLFSYHSARLFTPLIILLLLWDRRTLLLHFKAGRKYGIAIAVLAVFIAVAAYTMLFSGAGGRGSDIAIFNPTDNWANLADRRYEAVLAGVPDVIERIFSNKLVYVFKEFSQRYLSYFSPQFLFTQGAGEWTYGMIPGRGVLYLVELPFILVSLWSIFARGPLAGSARGPLKLLIIWILIAPIPAALTKGPGYAGNRVAVMMPALQILSAYGALVLLDLISQKWRVSKKLLLYSYIAILLVSLGFFLEDYYYHAPRDQAQAMLYGRKQAVELTSAIDSRYSQVVFSRSLSEPQIYMAFYKKWDPADYQKQAQDWLRYKTEGRSFVDQLGDYSLGKYNFTSIDSKAFGKKDTLLIGKSNEFSSNANVVEKIKFPNGQDAIWLVSTQ